jgi:hypothetical protein
MVYVIFVQMSVEALAKRKMQRDGAVESWRAARKIPINFFESVENITSKIDLAGDGPRLPFPPLRLPSRRPFD